MGFKIEGADFIDFISSPDEDFPVSTDEEVNEIKLTTPKGDIHYQEQVLREDLSILQGNYLMHDDVTIFGKADVPLLEVQFNLSGNDIFYKSKSRKENITPAMSANVTFLSSDENQADILFEKDIRYNTFDIHLPLSLLNKYAGESRKMDSFLDQIERNISSKLGSGTISINAAMLNTIQDIKNCRYNGLTRRIYLESKVYELIAFIYESAENSEAVHHLSKADLERIQLAALLIRENIESPFTIIELARQVGINQSKLKSGFKTVFGTTVFGYLQQIRMAEARKHLLDTRLSVQEISNLVGYQNMSNFSAAFKNIYGYSPAKLRS